MKVTMPNHEKKLFGGGNMINYIIVIAPIVLIALGIGLYRLATNTYKAIYDAIEYLKERKELKWM